MRKIIILYSFIIFSFFVFSYLFVDANFLSLHFLYSGFSINNRPVTTLIFVSFVLIYYFFYFYLLFRVRKKDLNLSSIKLLVAVSIFIFVFSYPTILSYDIFNYLTTAKVLFFHHENPYIVMPTEFLGDPMLPLTHAANNVALYGPSWILLTAIPFLISFGNVVFMLLNFKLFIAVFYLLTIILVWRITKNIFALTAFALNPLIVIETLVSGHNDIVMMCLSLFAFYLLFRKKILWSIFFLLLSILIKYATLFLVPIFLYVLLQTLKKEKINWDKTFYLSALLMMLVFFLSPIRQEIYPWYSIWFLTFSFLLPQKRFLFGLSISLSLGLLLRYAPYMLLGTYFPPVSFYKTVLTFVPSFIFIIFYILFRINYFMNFRGFYKWIGRNNV